MLRREFVSTLSVLRAQNGSLRHDISLRKEGIRDRGS
jgi:hypothetical protein